MLQLNLAGIMMMIEDDSDMEYDIDTMEECLESSETERNWIAGQLA